MYIYRSTIFIHIQIAELESSQAALKAKVAVLESKEAPSSEPEASQPGFMFVSLQC